MTSGKSKPSQYSIFRALSTVSIGEMIARGTVFISTILSARVLGSETFGHYVFYWSLIEGIWFVSQFDTETYGMRLIATGNQDVLSCYQRIASFRMVNALMLTLLCWGIASIFAVNDFIFFFLLSLYLPVYAIYPLWVARGLENLPVIFFGQVAWGAGYLLCVIIAFLFSFQLLVFIAPLAGAACAVSVAFYVWNISSSDPLVFRLSLKDYTLWFRRAGFFFIAGILAIVNTNFPIWAGRFLGGNTLDSFAPAYRYLVMLSGFVGILSLILIPRITSYLNQDKDKALRLAWGMGSVSLSITVAVSFVIWKYGERGMVYILGDDFVGASALFSMLSPMIVLFALQFIFGSFVTSFGAQKLYAFSLTVAIFGQCVFIAVGWAMKLEPSLVLGWASMAGMSMLVLALAFSAYILWVRSSSAA